MERLQIREISRLLAQKKHMSIGDAERFVTEMFNTITDGLNDDKQVIINGLGTFRQQAAKGKVFVNFTPDTELAEKVNAPFANFKTVEITGQLTPEDLAELGDSVLEEIADYDTPETEENKTGKEEEVSCKQDVSGTASEADPEKDNKGEKSPEPAVEQQVEALSEKVDALTEKIERKRKSRKMFWISTAVVLLLALLAGGGYYGYNQHQIKLENERVAAAKAAELKHKQDSIDNIKKLIDAVDLTDEQKLQLVGKGKEGVPEYPCSIDLEHAKKMINYGGYKIAGTLKIVEVRTGQSLLDVADENGLGQGEVYLQVYNALENVKEGQKIRIPLLERK